MNQTIIYRYSNWVDSGTNNPKDSDNMNNKSRSSELLVVGRLLCTRKILEIRRFRPDTVRIKVRNVPLSADDGHIHGTQSPYI